MSSLAIVEPKERRLLMDLVREAGVDVSDWGNYKGGAEKAASNPRYCYEWCFVQPNTVVVLNLWHSSMREKDGTVYQALNVREAAHKFRSARKFGGQRRARRMDSALEQARREQLPIRVIVCEGEMRDIEDTERGASRVHKRLLDPVPWHIESYDLHTGSCVLKRGVAPSRFVDQFSMYQNDAPEQPERHEVSGFAFARSPEVRRRVLVRASGRCEFCGEMGFEMGDGRIFLETHHIVPLSEGGPDTELNVAALCPNHHREAHHGLQKASIRESLLLRLSELAKEASGPHP